MAEESQAVCSTLRLETVQISFKSRAQLLESEFKELMWQRRIQAGCM